MQCEIHGCQLTPSPAVVNGLGGTLFCPACKLNGQVTIERDNLGRCDDLKLNDHNGRLNLINNRLTPITIGDQYQHREHGTGMVTWINVNNRAKFPIKIHFADKHVFCYFNIEGMQYSDQEHSFIDFPKVPKPEKPFVLPTKEMHIKTLFDNAMTGYKNISKWDRRFIELAEHVAQWSKDPSTKVGAVIVDGNKRIISLGFNGYPQHIPDDDLHDRERKYAKVLHSECNAILFSQRDLSGCTIYVWPLPPCSQCMSMIIQSGMKRVATVKPEGALGERWEKSNTIALSIAKEAGVIIDFLT